MAAEAASAEVVPDATNPTAETSEADPLPVSEEVAKGAPAEEVEMVEVPEAQLDSFVGAGCAELEKLSGARLEASPEAASDGKRKVLVRGSSVAVVRARVLLEERLRNIQSMSTGDSEPEGIEDAVRIAGHGFKDRAALLAHIKRLQSTVAENTLLGPEDAFFIFHLATFHPDFGSKMSSPVIGFKYGPHEAFAGAKCFFVVRADGSEEGISLSKCVEALLPPRGQKRARDEGEQLFQASQANGQPPVSKPKREINAGCILVVEGVPPHVQYEKMRELLDAYGGCRFLEFIREAAPTEEATPAAGTAAAEGGVVGAVAAEAANGEAATPAADAKEAPASSGPVPSEDKTNDPAPSEGAATAATDAAQTHESAAEDPAPLADGAPVDAGVEAEDAAVADAGEKTAKLTVVGVRARFADASCASKAAAELREVEGVAVTARILTGDEERAFWERLWERADRSDKGKAKGKGKGKGKGKDKGKSGKAKGCKGGKAKHRD